MGLTTIPQDTNKEATQLLVKAKTDNLDVALSTRASAANQTTLGSQTTKINDGTNTAAVKAASTAAVATDPALVVALSPNNPIAVTATISTAATATQYTTSVSTVSVQILASNVNRKGFLITNVGGNTVYISFGAAPTTSIYNIALVTSQPNERYEPQSSAVYTGAINAIRGSGTSNVVVVEFI